MFAPLVLKTLADVSGGGTPGANQPFFKDGAAADPLVVTTPRVWLTVQCAFSVDSVLTVEKNGASLLLNSGAPVPAGTLYSFGLMVKDSDEINFSIDSAAEVTDFEVRGHREYF